MSTRKVVFSDSLDTGYADNVGLFRAVPLTSIKEDISMGFGGKAAGRVGHIQQHAPEWEKVCGNSDVFF
jgi:hypothetical protein